MQLGEFFYDGDKKVIYEAPTVGFSFTTDINGYRIYTPNDEPSAPTQLQYSTYELWSRAVDFMNAFQWSEIIFELSGGAYRYTDQFNEQKFSLIDLRFQNDWAYVQSDYPHSTFIKGNLFPNTASNITFDSSRITRQGVIPSIFFSDAGERAVADDEAIRQANENSVYASFQGAVWIDKLSPYSDIGTDIKPNGNAERPVNTVQLGTQIADTRGFRALEIMEDLDFIAGDDIANLTIKGVSRVSTSVYVDTETLCYKTIFNNIDLTGILDGNSEVDNCIVRDLVYFYGHIRNSDMAGTLTLGGSSPAKLDNCSMLSFDIPFIVDCGGFGQDAIISSYEGFITIKNLTGANKIGVSFVNGTIIIDETCTGGNIVVMGNYDIVDNSGAGCIVNTDNKIAHVHDVVVAANNASQL